ncbi:MAG: hypothetical protein KKI08_13565, partial [Armatimonadetes bacterium]|nr:hypothetical protein [Armatimonadota bacterium]
MALALTNLDLASVPPGVDLAAAGANVCGATDLDASFAALLFGLQTFPDRADLLGTATDDDTLARPAAPPRRRPDDETSPEADAASLQPQFALAAAVPTVVVTAAPRPVAVPVATPEETARQSVASPNTDPATDSTRPPTWATRMGADLGAIPASFPPPTETENPLRAVPTAT